MSHHRGSPRCLLSLLKTATLELFNRKWKLVLLGGINVPVENTGNANTVNVTSDTGLASGPYIQQTVYVCTKNSC